MFYLYFYWPHRYFSALCLHKIHFQSVLGYRTFIPATPYWQEYSTIHTRCHPKRLYSSSSGEAIAQLYEDGIDFTGDDPPFHAASPFRQSSKKHNNVIKKPRLGHSNTRICDTDATSRDKVPFFHVL